jgi:hypothetical protein
MENTTMSKAFKSVAAAATHGSKRHNAYGYFACDKREKYRHVVAEVRSNGRVVGVVWC